MSAAQAPAEALTLERLASTAALAALNARENWRTSDSPEEEAQDAAEALLTPRARLELAAELLASLGAHPAVYWHDTLPAFEALRALGGAVTEELVTGLRPPQVDVRVTLTIGALHAAASYRRPATLDDARRLLEGGQ